MKFLRGTVFLLFLSIPQLVMASGSPFPTWFALIILFIPLFTFLSAILLPIIIVYGKKKDLPRILLGLIGAVAPIALVGISYKLLHGSFDIVVYAYLGIPFLYLLAFITRKLTTERCVTVLKSLTGVMIVGLSMGLGMYLTVLRIQSAELRMQLISESEEPVEIRQLQEAIDLKLSKIEIDLRSESYQLSAGEVVKLSLEGSHLGKIPKEIGQLTQLQILDLSFNDLTRYPPEIGLPSEIGQLTQLKELILEHSELKQLPPQVGQLTQLRKLNLEGNQLTQLPPEIGQLTQLQLLHLLNNWLHQLPQEIGQLVQLQELDLANNQLTELPKEIGQLVQLQELGLANNQLTELPKEIGQLTQLRRLDLRGNKLTQLPPEIGQLIQLQKLYLSDNQLTQLPKEIMQLTQLQGVGLSNNPLAQLSEEIKQFLLHIPDPDELPSPRIIMNEPTLHRVDE